MESAGIVDEDSAYLRPAVGALHSLIQHSGGKRIGHLLLGTGLIMVCIDRQPFPCRYSPYLGLPRDCYSSVQRGAAKSLRELPYM